jgi:hypothetical protein
MQDATKKGYHGSPQDQKKPRKETPTGQKPAPANEKLGSDGRPGNFRIKY